MSMKDKGFVAVGANLDQRDHTASASRQANRRQQPRPQAISSGLAAGSSMFAKMPAYTPVTRGAVAYAQPEPFEQEQHGQAYESEYSAPHSGSNAVEDYGYQDYGLGNPQAQSPAPSNGAVTGAPEALNNGADPRWYGEPANDSEPIYQNGYAGAGYAEPEYQPQDYQQDYQSQGYQAQGYQGQGYQDQEAAYGADPYSQQAYGQGSYGQGSYDQESQGSYDQSYEQGAYGQDGYKAPTSYAQNGAYAPNDVQPPSYGAESYSEAFGNNGVNGAYQAPNGAYQENALDLDAPLDLGLEETLANDAADIEQSFEAYGDAGQGYEAQAYAEQPYQGQNYQPQNYPDQGYQAEGYQDQGYQEQAYQDYGNGQSYQDPAAYQGQAHNGQAYGEEAYSGQADAYGQYADQQPYDDAVYGESQYHNPNDTSRALQPFDAHYEEAPPQVPLDPNAQFYDGEQADAEFLDEETAPEAQEAKKRKLFGGRSAFMISSALLGAIALGGALAFAYKESGGALNGTPPVIQADNAPVKEAPQNPGGAEMPHHSKLIYDRLTEDSKPEQDHLVPRQESLSVPNMPAGKDVPNTEASAGRGANLQAAANSAAAAAPSGADNNPRKVRTLVVRPDGTLAPSPAPQPVSVSVPATTASIPTVPLPPKPAERPRVAPRRTAEATTHTRAAPARHAADGRYVVQVSSKRNQTAALASFADMQQKYPNLLGQYRPIVRRVDLGSRGIWYRLQIGPMGTKMAAAKLCNDLKAQGLSDCLVMTQ